MKLPKILIGDARFGGYHPDPMDKLRGRYEVVSNTFGRRLTAGEVSAMARDCEGMIAGLEPLNKSVLETLPALRCISRIGVGLDNIDLTYAAERGIAVCT